MIKIGAAHAKRPILLHPEEGAFPQVLAALCTARVLEYREDDDLCVPLDCFAVQTSLPLGDLTVRAQRTKAAQGADSRLLERAVRKQ